MRLLVRADDAGLCDSVNRAIVETVTAGVARNVSVMAPTPAFDSAAALLRTLPGIAVGLHVTLTSEWHAPRWGPVLPVCRVPSLVDPTGCFLPAPGDLRDRGGPDLGEAVAEIEAQLARARAAGLDVGYLDEHMGVGWLPGLRDELAALAGREGLVYAPNLDRLEDVDTSGDDPGAGLAEPIRTAGSGTYLFVAHPGLDTPELRAIRGVGFDEPGSVARTRDADRRALVSDAVRRICVARDVTLARYTDLDPAGLNLSGPDHTEGSPPH